MGKSTLEVDVRQTRKQPRLESKILTYAQARIVVEKLRLEGFAVKILVQDKIGMYIRISIPEAEE